MDESEKVQDTVLEKEDEKRKAKHSAGYTMLHVGHSTNATDGSL